MFSEKIKTLRNEKGLSQEKLAAELFVRQQSVSRWETGKGYPDLPTLQALASFFQVRVDDLLSEEEYHEAKQTKKVHHSPFFHLALWAGFVFLSLLVVFLLVNHFEGSKTSTLLLFWSGVALLALALILSPILLLLYAKASRHIAFVGFSAFLFLFAFGLGIFLHSFSTYGVSTPVCYFALVTSLFALGCSGFFFFYYLRFENGGFASEENTSSSPKIPHKFLVIFSSIAAVLSLLLSGLFLYFSHQLRWGDDVLSIILLFVAILFWALMLLWGGASALSLLVLERRGHKKMVFALGMLAVLALSLLGAGVGSAIDANAYEQTYSYTAEKWLAATPEQRYRIYPYFIKDHDLIGETKTTVLAYLGDPSRGKDGDAWEYNLGIAPGLFNIDPSILQISFSSEGLVRDYSLYES